MARYSLIIDDPMKKKSENIGFNEKGMLVKKGKSKQELYFLDQFIFKTSINREALIRYLNHHGYDFSNNSYVSFGYHSNGFQKRLSVHFKKDPILEYFSIYFNFWTSKMDLQSFKIKLRKDKVYQQFQACLLRLFQDKHFYSYLIENQNAYIKRYTLDFIESYRANSNFTRDEQKETYYNSIENIKNYFTSYKQLRGMRLAILEFEKEYGIKIPFEVEKELKRLKQQIYHNSTIDQTRNFSSTNEEVNANLAYTKTMTIDEYNEQFYSIYDLDSAPSMPWNDNFVEKRNEEQNQKEIEEYEKRQKRR